MKREYFETVQVRHFELICDVCGYVQNDSHRCFGKCEFCNKHVCYKHFSWSEDHSSDYPRYKRACPEHEEKLKEIINKYEARKNYQDIDEMILAALRKEKK